MKPFLSIASSAVASIAACAASAATVAAAARCARRSRARSAFSTSYPAMAVLRSRSAVSAACSVCGLLSSRRTVSASTAVPGYTSCRSTRPSVSAVIQRISSGTSTPFPRTWRSIVPRFTESIHSVPPSTVGRGRLEARQRDGGDDDEQRDGGADDDAPPFAPLRDFRGSGYVHDLPYLAQESCQHRRR